MARKRSLGLWFRFYASVLNDTKIEALNDAVYRIWTKLNCIATDNGGIIPGDVKTIAILCRRPEGKVRDALQVLLSAGLMERCDDNFTPHNWVERQYSSDVSTSRVQAFRDRSKEQKQHTETHSETLDETFHPYVDSTSSTESSDSSEIQNTENQSAPRARCEVVPEPSLPDWLPKKPWQAFVKMRRKIRAPLTDEAIPLAIAKLEKLRAVGHDPGAVLEQSVMRSWRGLFEIGAEQGRGSGRKESPLEQAHRIANELANEHARNTGTDHGPDHGAGDALPQIGYDRRRA